ncbi:DNA polymerase III subunit gamma/tau [Candidatus Parcubacteria bacterium]|nr:DNA polymerase III subunit gamma/tau [Patescibacteria group bacterium]MBU4466544.1 DNA polymerase III subunit gamma/tau [Patescibacteria group bacterium]MCG2688347.1 DNA polymerase III subunit gamma/tau [Candidatus Parcubacteria bacterium]
MSKVFYRKYRPKFFQEIIAQEHIVKTLTNALASDILSQGYLFSGPRGSGKTTIARLFAKSLNCTDRAKGKFEPCDKCSSCLEINDSRSIDLIEIDAASHRGIDEIRELKEGIKFAPAKSKYKVFIIDESHQLTKEASNALLKTLEEPPSHAVFILATTEIHKMIPTIISRCQRFDFKRLKMAEVIKRLEIIAKKEKLQIEKPALELIALSSGGSLRDAETILDQTATFCSKDKITLKDLRELLGVVGLQKAAELVDALLAKDAKTAILLLGQVFEEGNDLTQFVSEIINYLHASLMFKIGGEDLHNPLTDGLSDEEFGKLKGQADKFQEGDLRKLLDLFLDAQNRMKSSPILQLPLELAIAEYCGIE